MVHTTLTPIAPVARAILFRATPGSLYYSAVAKHDAKFTNALGSIFETYLRRQLETCQPQNLLHDLEYEKGKWAVDFIMVMPAAVLLIEAKATPLTQESRLGGGRLEDDLARAPGKGMDQIENTARLIRDNHPSFSVVPKDRKFLGIVVTLEPYYGCSNEAVFKADPGEVHKWLANIREVEHLVSLQNKSIDQALIELSESTDDRGSIEPAIVQNAQGRNCILDEAWKKYPFNPD